MKEAISVLLLLFFVVGEVSASNWRISQLVDKCPDRHAHLYFSVVSFLRGLWILKAGMIFERILG